MLTLLSTLISFLMGGLPKFLDFFQDRSDKKHELDMARMQSERELALAERGFLAQQKIEEIKMKRRQGLLQSVARKAGVSLPTVRKYLIEGNIVSPNIGMFWEAGYKLNIGTENIVKERAIICIWCARWNFILKLRHSINNRLIIDLLS